jgi:hypothetical protein
MLNSSSSLLSRVRSPRALVWLLFVTVLVVAGALANSSLGFDKSLVGAGTRSAAVAPQSTPSEHPSAMAAGGAYLLAEPNVTHVSVNSKDANQALNDLPAWRWDNFMLDTSDEASITDAGGTVGSVLNGVAGILFVFANFLWGILLAVMKIALSASLVSMVGDAISKGMVGVANAVLLVVGLIWGIVLFKLVRDVVFKQAAQKAVVGFVLFTIASGGIAWTAHQPETSTDGRGNLTAGTIPWMAETVSGRLSQVATEAGTLFGLAQSGEFSNPGDSTEGPGYNCSTYTYTLQKRYENAVKNDTTASNKSGSTTLIMADKMWETTFFNSWTSAQFGMPRDATDYNLGQRVACHAAEFNSKLPATGDQRAVDAGKQANIGQIPIANAAYAGIGGDTINANMFGPFTNKVDERKSVTAWMGCQQHGKLLESKNGGGAFMKGIEGWEPNGSKCQEYFQSSGDGPEGDDELEVFGDDYDKFEGKKTAPNLQAADWAAAYTGQDGGGRMMQGLLAVVVAILFLIALGGIAGGLIVAQFMLVVLLILLPLMFAFLAMGMSQGPRMLKLTGTTMAAKAMFTLVLAFLSMLITIGQQAITALGADGAGIFDQILYGLMPILALLVLRKITSNLGMGDIIKPTGALSFMAASSMMATRDQKLSQQVTSSASKGGLLAANPGSAASKLQKKLEKRVGTIAKKGTDKVKDKAEEKGAYGSKRRHEAEERKANTKKKEADLRRSSIKRKQEENTKRISEGKKPKRIPMTDLVKDAGLDRKMVISAYVNTLAGKAEKLAQVGNVLGAAGVLGSGLTAGTSGVVGLGMMAGSRALHNRAGKLKARTGNALDEALTRKAAGVNTSIEVDEEVLGGRQNWGEVSNNQQALGRRLATDVSGAATRELLSARSELQMKGEGPFKDMADLNGAKQAFAQANGIPEEFVVGSMSGLVMVNPALDIKNPDVRKHFTPDSLAACGEVFMDVKVASRMRGESEDDYTLRMMGEKISHGLVSQRGQTVDVVMSKAGLDVSSFEGLADVQRWLAGGECEALGSLVLNSGGQSSKHIQSAVQAWAQERTSMVANADIASITNIADAMRNARAASSETAAAAHGGQGELKRAMEELGTLMTKQEASRSMGLDPSVLAPSVQQQRESLMEMATSMAGTMAKKFEADMDLQVASMASLGASETEIDTFVRDVTAKAEQRVEEIKRAARSASRGGAHLDELSSVYDRALADMDDFERATADREAAAVAESKRYIEVEMSRVQRVGRQVRPTRVEVRGQGRPFPAESAPETAEAKEEVPA